MMAKFPEHETTDQCSYVPIVTFVAFTFTLVLYSYKFYTKVLSVPLQEKGTYRSWWVDWETAL